MKINELQISNILSFKYFDDISGAPKIIFDNSLNIFIGENGSGKSTALEVINFIFKKVLFTQFNVNQDFYYRRSELTAGDKKQILVPANSNSYSGFRLEPNWDTENNPQKIKLTIELDEIDTANIQNLVDNKEKLDILANSYTTHSVVPNNTTQKIYTIEATLNNADKTFSVNIFPNNSDPGYLYLVNYNFYKELINFYNFENPNNPINPLYESFTLIGGYRNYHAFTPTVSLKDAHASQQIQQIKTKEFSKSLNTSEQSEPAIFNLVRLRVAGAHYDLGTLALTPEQREEQANDASFLKAINAKLKLVSLKCKIRVSDRRSRQYAFEFIDTHRNRVLNDINSLSSGQKAIIHLVFEAYGRGDLKGGVVIIDEPEIHLHYQFQHEYLRVIEEINQEQNCQYVLVTHSESLINSVTIHKVKRFALNEANNTVIKAPVLTTDQKMLVKILDNTRSTYAFFAKKVILVEGETDRYFFKALINGIAPNLNQELAVLDIQGKSDYEAWKEFFEAFGLTVYFFGDLDEAFKFIYPTNPAPKLNTAEAITNFKTEHQNWKTDIEQKYSDKIYILKDGDLEDYLGIHNKGLPETIKFCNEGLQNYLADDTNEKSKEIRFILNEITSN
ncbi:MAG: AAA family ATPase [Patescibacteria group bacterium]